MKITLTPVEIASAAQVGLLRRVSSIQNKLTDRRMNPNQMNWEIDIEGACAELAAAKGLNIFWCCGINTFKAADLGSNIQVRHTAKRSNRLIIRDGDKAEDVFVLVTGSAPEYEIVGWVLGKDGKNPSYLNDANDIGKPAYFVPQSALSPIATLIQSRRRVV